MIEPDKNVGTHEDQRRASRLAALTKAGIGSAYLDKKLDSVPGGTDLKEWLIENYGVFREGGGLDFRGVGPNAHNLLNLTARALIYARLTVRVLSLTDLPKILNSDEDREDLFNTQCIFIRAFETTHVECPLSFTDVAKVEAFLGQRLDDTRSVSVCRHEMLPKGWWGADLEAMLKTYTVRRVEIGQ